MRHRRMRNGLDGGARLAGMRDLTLVALEGRYGTPLDDDIAEAVVRADERTLTEIASHITTDMLVDLRRRLGIE